MQEALQDEQIAIEIILHHADIIYMGSLSVYPNSWVLQFQGLRDFVLQVTRFERRFFQLREEAQVGEICDGSSSSSLGMTFSSWIETSQGF